MDKISAHILLYKTRDIIHFLPANLKS